MIDPDGARTYWLNAFNECIGQEQEKTGTNPLDWRAGGRATKAYPNKEDGDWWAENGPGLFQTFTDWWESSGWQVWYAPNGTPGVEIGFTDYFGDILVKAFVDLVAVTSDGELVVCDYKTGAHMPDTGMQLGLYACMIEKAFGIRPSGGYFYDARNGVMHYTGTLDRWTIPVFTELFAQFDRGLQAEIFLPNVGMMCRSCGVKDYCYVLGGMNATLDPLFTIDGGK